jgi:hypothetical protein
MHRSLHLLSALLAATAGCARSDAPPADTAQAAARADTGAARADTSSTPVATSDTAWVVTPHGVGPVRIGMPARAALAALGLPAERASAAGEGCRYLAVQSLKRGIGLMVERDSVVRVDVRDSTLATAEGARVGDAEARVRTLYGDRAVVSPHKYTGPTGHYVTVTPGADSSYRLVFETDGQRVTTYHAGRMPAVAYVEGCD